MFVIVWFDGYDEVFEGVMSGFLVWLICGVGGFGYDLMFMFEGYDVICGEMDKVEKNKISY